MKRIEFIAPVEAMRGNLGSKQDLEYGANGEHAFESDANKTNYAKNYQPRFIGAKVSRTGLKYFAVKVKSAVKTTAAWLLQCALMGATAAIYGVVIANASLRVQLGAEFKNAQAAGYTATFHKWVTNAIRSALAAKSATIAVSGPTQTITLGNNPFSTAETAIEISNDLLVKFWRYLCPNGIMFEVAGVKGIAVSGDDFSTVTGDHRMNVLGLEIVTIGEYMYIKKGNDYVIDASGEYVSDGTEITDDAVFSLTDVAPEA